MVIKVRRKIISVKGPIFVFMDNMIIKITEIVSAVGTLLKK